MALDAIVGIPEPLILDLWRGRLLTRCGLLDQEKTVGLSSAPAISLY
jgi:hypothetical protein